MMREAIRASEAEATAAARAARARARTRARPRRRTTWNARAATRTDFARRRSSRSNAPSSRRSRRTTVGDSTSTSRGRWRPTNGPRRDGEYLVAGALATPRGIPSRPPEPRPTVRGRRMTTSVARALRASVLEDEARRGGPEPVISRHPFSGHPSTGHPFAGHPAWAPSDGTPQ